MFLLYLMVGAAFLVEINGYLLIISEEENIPAVLGITMAINFHRSLGTDVHVKKVFGVKDNYTAGLELLSDIYEYMTKSSKYPEVLLDITVGMFSRAVRIFANSLNIPTITTASYKTRWTKSENNIFHFISPHSILSEIIYFIVSSEQYRTAAILVDEFYERCHNDKTFLENTQARHTIIYIDRNKIIDQLRSVKEQKIKNIFVVGNISSIELVLNNGEYLDMHNRIYNWHVLSYERKRLTCNCKNATILFVEPTKELMNDNNQYFRDYYVDDGSRLLVRFYFDITIAALDLLRDLSKTPPCSPNCSVFASKFKNFTRNVPYFMKNRYIERKTAMMFGMNIEVLTFFDGEKFSSSEIGEWNYKSTTVNLVSFTRYIRKHVYNIVVQIRPPFVYKSGSGYYGLCIDLLNEIATSMDFDYNIYESPDGQVGSIVGNGKYTGMIREIVEKRADIALGAITVNFALKQVVDFTVPFHDMIGHSIVMKKFVQTTDLFRFFRGFDQHLWLGILLTYLCTCIFIWLFYKYSPYLGKMQVLNVRQFTLIEAAWFCLCSITRQGGDEAPANTPSRIVAASWWLFVFMMLCSYNADLSAVMTMQRSEERVDNLLDQHKIHYSVIKNSELYSIFKRKTAIENELHNIWENISVKRFNLPKNVHRSIGVWEYPVNTKYRKIWGNLEMFGFVNSEEEGIKKVLASKSTEDGFALLMDSIEARHLMMANCELHEIAEFNKRFLAIVVRKGSWLKEKFNTVHCGPFHEKRGRKSKKLSL